MRATGLLQPGSLVRWIYRVKLPDNAADDAAATALIDNVRAALPEAGWEIRSRSNASPQLERTISRFTQFLTLVGLAALLVGGVGVANAVKSHIDRRRDVIAAFKALGATGRDVFAIYLTQVTVLAAVGSLIGQKVVINEFVAYLQLADIVNGKTAGVALTDQGRLIATYALCGFANFSSIAIQIGGIGGLAPERRGDLARFGLRAVLGGSIATFMTATIAGVLSSFGG